MHLLPTDLIIVTVSCMAYPPLSLAKLQRVQNAAARLVSNTQKFNRVSPILHELHGLPVQ